MALVKFPSAGTMRSAVPTRNVSVVMLLMKSLGPVVVNGVVHLVREGLFHVASDGLFMLSFLSVDPCVT